VEGLGIFWEGRRREREESEERVASDLDYPGLRIGNPIRFHPTPEIGFQPPFRTDRFPQTDRLWGNFFPSDFSGGSDRVGLSLVDRGAMLIEELPGDPGGGRGEGGEDELLLPRREDGDAAEGESGVVMRVAVDAKRAAVGVSARMLFYPTLVYNVVRNRFEKHFHWWDQIDEVRGFFSPF
jgi:hypothetical protein